MQTTSMFVFVGMVKKFNHYTQNGHAKKYILLFLCALKLLNSKPNPTNVSKVKRVNVENHSINWSTDLNNRIQIFKLL